MKGCNEDDPWYVTNWAFKKEFPDLERDVKIFEVLKELSFSLHWRGQFISVIGDSLVPIAVTFAVLKLTDYATDLGIVLGSLWGGRILFLLFGGVWADRFSRKWVMIGSGLVRAMVHGWIALFFFFDWISIWHLALASAIYGAASAFFTPAAGGLLPQNCDKRTITTSQCVGKHLP